MQTRLLRIKGVAAALLLALVAAACGSAEAGGDGPAPDDRTAASFVGLTLDDAGDRADRQGRPWRVIRLDGEDQAVTDDFSPTRLNFTVEDGIVVGAVTDAGMAPGADAEAASYVGLTLEQAGDRAAAQGRVWRVISLDGEEQAITADFQAERLNFTVDGGVVVAAITDAEWVEGA